MDELDQRVDEILAQYRSLPKDPEPIDLAEGLLETVREIENFPCNQSGQDKSWVLRVEEARRRYFANLRRKPGESAMSIEAELLQEPRTGGS